MNLPRASVGRPVFTTMVTLMVIALGVVSLGRLRIDMLPDVELPTVSVRTEYEGASPEVMETAGNANRRGDRRDRARVSKR